MICSTVFFILIVFYKAEFNNTFSLNWNSSNVLESQNFKKVENKRKKRRDRMSGRVVERSVGRAVGRTRGSVWVCVSTTRGGVVWWWCDDDEGHWSFVGATRRRFFLFFICVRVATRRVATNAR